MFQAGGGGEEVGAGDTDQQAPAGHFWQVSCYCTVRMRITCFWLVSYFCACAPPAYDRLSATAHAHHLLLTGYCYCAVRMRTTCFWQVSFYCTMRMRTTFLLLGSSYCTVRMRTKSFSLGSCYCKVRKRTTCLWQVSLKNSGVAERTHNL